MSPAVGDLTISGPAGSGNIVNEGSISAEHGLGRLKTDEARRYKTPLEIATMRAIRQAIDPQRIMNPAVLF